MELEDIHLVTLLATALVILYSDHLGFAYFRGKKETLPAHLITRFHQIIWVGLVGMIATGVMLMAPAWDYYIHEPAFLAKMFFVLVLVINGFAIGKLSHVASLRPFVALTAKEKKILFLSGTLSAVSWLSSATIGLFFL